jgi:hypothetical protein
MSSPTSQQWSVKITQSGRSGSVDYRETAGCISFYWEFGGGDTVAIISIEDLAVWSTRHSWAVERRREILEESRTRLFDRKLRHAEQTSMTRMDTFTFVSPLTRRCSRQSRLSRS